MKFFVVLASLVAAAAAQGARILRPTSGETFSTGQDVLVTVEQPTSPTNLEQLGIGLAIRSCNPTGCPTDGFLGTLLYSGPFNPQDGDASSDFVSYQNFTVTIPDDGIVGDGPAVLNLAHAYFVGASTLFVAEVNNVTLNIN